MSHPRVFPLIWIIMSVFLASAVGASYEIGDTVDDFILFDADNMPFRLYDFAGKVILINFWWDD